MGTYLLIFNNTLYESTDSSGTSWVQEPFPAMGAPKGATALGTVAGGAWVLDGFAPAPLWRRVDQNTYVPLNVPNTSPPVQITSDLSPNFLDFYTTPFFARSNIVGDIGVPTQPSGQFTQQMYVESGDGGRTPGLSAFANLPFPTGSTLMRFWADERQGLPPFPPGTFGYFLAQVRRQLGSDFLYFALAPGGLGSQPPILSSGPIVQQIYGDFIRTQRGTFLVFAQATGTPATDTIFRSTDGGATWTRSTGVTELNPGLIECDDGTVLAPVSGAGVLRSTDDGQSFKPALSVSGVTVGLTGLKYFPGLNVLFAYVLQEAGSAPFGTAMYMSLDQGRTWTQVFTSATPARLGPQTTSWMAVTGGSTFWGVDSLTQANSPIGGFPTLYDALVSQGGAGRVPGFWGRYIGPTNGNLTQPEVDFLHSKNCRVLLIYNDTYVIPPGFTQPRIFTYADGQYHANQAIKYIGDKGLTVPGNKRAWIYLDTEVPQKGTVFQSPTSDCFQGWSDTMFGSIYGGAGGVYGNTNPQQDFDRPYCLAYNNDINMRMGSAPALLYSNQPNQCAGAKCNPQVLASNPPAFGTVTVPQCNPGTPPVVVYQYAIDLTLYKQTHIIDFDLANGAGFAGMW